MAKLLVGEEWYQAVASADFYEAHFENLVMQHAPKLYPDYFAVPFKTTVSSEHGTKKPDLALIDREYRAWWVVEVELAHHSFNDHVMPQVQVLTSADYGQAQAQALLRQDPSLSMDRLTEMMRGAPPTVLVLVNQAVPDWVQPLAYFSAVVGIVEVFRSTHNAVILRINGEQPAPLGALVSNCRFDPVVPARLLIVDSPAGLGPGVGGKFSIEYKGAVSEWRRIDAANRVWLAPRAANPLPLGREFELRRSEGGRLVLRERPGGRRWQSS